jgi:bla regulator protein BlaR1
VTTFIVWGEATLIASAALMLLVLVVRAPIRRWVGPQLGYALWAIPALRLMLPAMPTRLLDAMPFAHGAATRLPILIVGPRGASDRWHGLEQCFTNKGALTIWLIGAVGLFALYAGRHFQFCRRLPATSIHYGRVGTIRIIAADVEGPLAFGVFRRVIAVPYAFAKIYDASERDLALAHESAHHARGDLLANWASIIVLALHWWNPVAWIAIRAFREDQEFAADTHVLAAKGSGALPSYTHVLAKAAGIGALPACNLNARSKLKGRLMMLGQNQRTSRQFLIGSVALVLFGSTALAATAVKSKTPGAAAGNQAVTIGVKPDGSGAYALVIGSTLVAPSSALPKGITLPADFTGAGGCDLKAAAKPYAMAVKGTGRTQTYTVMCASAAPAPVRMTLAEGLASLKTMRASVARQQASKAFPEVERARALGAIDRSIREVQATLVAIA